MFIIELKRSLHNYIFSRMKTRQLFEKYFNQARSEFLVMGESSIVL